jgi:16S rRNA (guanine(966)-N(2))-methyltransferase RsmD
MRIIAGELRGRRLRAPSGLATRPTSDRLREALFNILGAEVAGSRFLDLFAGSGAVGLEAASRGAEEVVAVENSRKAFAILEANVELCGMRERVRLVPKDAAVALKAFDADRTQFDIVFVDPPYESDHYSRVLPLLGSLAVVAADGLVVVERDARRPLLDVYGVLRKYREVTHGGSTLAFLRE